MKAEATEPTQPQQVQLDQAKLAVLQKTAPQVLAEAQEFAIQDEGDYEASAPFLTSLANRQKQVEEFFEKPAEQAHALHKFITTLRGTLTLPYVQAQAVIKQRRQDYRAAKERERLVKEAQEREKAKAEAEAAALKEAERLVEIGEPEAADSVIERAVNTPPPAVMVPSSVPKQKGISVRKVWKFNVKNPDLIKREWLIPKDKYDPQKYPKVGEIVEKLGRDAESIVGGIEVFESETESVRRTGS